MYIVFFVYVYIINVYNFKKKKQQPPNHSAEEKKSDKILQECAEV